MIEKYYYQVIPLTRLPFLKRAFFTYYSAEKIAPGSVVKIKFNHKNIRGIVVDTKDRNYKPNFKTLPIEEVITTSQINKQQLSLAKSVSDYYLTPLSIVLKFFTPQLTKRNSSEYFQNLSSQINSLFQKKSKKELILTPQQKKAIHQITNHLRTKNASIDKFLLFGPPSAGKTEVLMNVIKKTLAKNQQSLVIIPEIFLSHQEIIRYSEKFIGDLNSDEIAILHSGLKKSEITTIWNSAQNGSLKVLISTRMGIFWPFKNLGLIIIDEEQDISHKQWDTPPFYHTRKVAELLQSVWKEKKRDCKVIFSSSTPAVESWYKARKEPDRKIISLPRLLTKTVSVNPPEIELVDLKKYYQKDRNIILSPELKSALKKILNNNEIAMILVPRRGKSKLMVCRDCRETPICPDCQTPLIHSVDNYCCLHCNFKISNISKCPHCGSFRLMDIGFGTESAADLIQTSFPSAKIAIADGTTFQDNLFRQEIIKKLHNNEIDFLVGTYSIAKGLDIPKVGLVAILNADNWPGQTDFRFDENYLSTIMQLAGRVNRPGSNQDGKCLIQTFDPTNLLFSYLREWDWEKFLKYELKNRQALSYPPFTHLLKITFRDRSKEIVEKELNKLFAKLSKIKTDNLLSVLPPYYGHQAVLRGQHQKNILLKVKKLPITDKTLLKILDLPTGWKIDVDTENIF